MAKRASRAASWLVALGLALAPALAHAEITHVVGKGQTLGRIAKRYHVSVEAIREANNLRPGQRIHPGLSLTIPEKGDAPAKKGPEKVEKGGRGRADKGAERDKKGAGRRGKGDDPEENGGGRVTKGPKRKGFVRMMRGSEKLETQLVGRRGHLTPNALPGLSRILRFYPTGEKVPIDPRLAALVAEVSDHFGGRVLRVTSGYRPYSPAQHTPHSNHNSGRAMDFAVDGVPNSVLRDFCRTFRNAGVGWYPNSTFVHLDVRAGRAYWIDYSRPGEAPHYDSPNAQHGADEAVGDVEPHSGAGSPSPGAPDDQSGSAETQ
jgi:uncharacterized protein YcbK (DUF882 family)